MGITFLGDGNEIEAFLARTQIKKQGLTMRLSRKHLLTQQIVDAVFESGTIAYCETDHTVGGESDARRTVEKFRELPKKDRDAIVKFIDAI